MLAERFADIHGVVGGERFGGNRGIPQEAIKFQQDQLADDDVLAVLELFKEGSRRGMFGIPRFHSGQQVIRVDGDHCRGRQRSSSSLAAISWSTFSGT